MDQAVLPPEDYLSSEENREYLHNKGDKRCADVLFACSHYGNLRFRELLCLFREDPEILRQSIERYRSLGYITVQKDDVEALEKVLLEIYNMNALSITVEAKRALTREFMTNHINPKTELRLSLTPDGNIAAQASLFVPRPPESTSSQD
jgi:hypothetical protein